MALPGSIEIHLATEIINLETRKEYNSIADDEHTSWREMDFFNEN